MANTKKMKPEIDRAREKANSVHLDLEVRRLEDLADLESLCRSRGINVVFEKLGNLEGLMLRKQRLIAVRDDIPQIGRTRFTIAHELGHWELHPGLNQLQACSASDIHGYRGSNAELEANAFAAEFLMPGFLFSSETKFLAPTIDSIKKLSNRFNTTLTATAVRLCEFSSLPMFVCFSTNGRIKWYVRSKGAQYYRFASYGSELDGDTLARYCTSGPEDPNEPEEVEPSAWFPEDGRNDEFKVLEESVIFASYGVTMSIVTIDA